MKKNWRENWPLFLIIGVVLAVFLKYIFSSTSTIKSESSFVTYDSNWVSPSLFIDRTLEGENRALVIYGQELIAHK
jgi:hypothetical protein